MGLFDGISLGWNLISKLSFLLKSVLLAVTVRHGPMSATKDPGNMIYWITLITLCIDVVFGVTRSNKPP